MKSAQSIVDGLIEERATGLMRHPRLWRLIKQTMFPLLGYREAIRMVERHHAMSGLEVFASMSRYLDMRVEVEGLERLPQEGGAILMANHPAGIADGIAVYDAIKPLRDDLVFFANRDALRAAPGLSDVIIPVEWVEEKRDHSRSKETVRAMISAFKAEKVVVIFPSGRLAEPTLQGLVERPWRPSAVGLAQKYRLPVVPMHIRGPNTLFYYALWFINTELKDMTLFRELLNKKRQRYQISLAEPFFASGETAALTEALRHFVTNDMPNGKRQFEKP